MWMYSVLKLPKNVKEKSQDGKAPSADTGVIRADGEFSSSDSSFNPNS